MIVKTIINQMFTDLSKGMGNLNNAIVLREP